MTLLARDEADVIAENLWFHFQQGVDWRASATDRGLREDLSVSRFFAGQGVHGPPGILAY